MSKQTESNSPLLMAAMKKKESCANYYMYGVSLPKTSPIIHGPRLKPGSKLLSVQAMPSPPSRTTSPANPVTCLGANSALFFDLLENYRKETGAGIGDLQVQVEHINAELGAIRQKLTPTPNVSSSSQPALSIPTSTPQASSPIPASSPLPTSSQTPSPNPPNSARAQQPRSAGRRPQYSTCPYVYLVCPHDTQNSIDWCTNCKGISTLKCEAPIPDRTNLGRGFAKKLPECAVSCEEYINSGKLLANLGN